MKAVATCCILLALAGCGPGEGTAVRGVDSFGRAGRQPGEFSKPRAVAITASGALVVIDRTGRVQVFDLATTEFRHHWWLPEWANGTPTGMSVDPTDDTLWIADTHYHRVLHYTVEGELLGQFGEVGEAPGQFVFITDVVPDPDGKTVWATDFGRRNRVMQFTREGKFLHEWGTELYSNTDLDRPQAAALSPDGALLYVLDAGNHRVNVYTREGVLARTIGTAGTGPGALKYPYDIAVAPDGSLYVAEFGNNRLSRFTAQGEFSGSWGSPGQGAGQLAAPWGIAIGPGGELAIADTNNHRLQIMWSPPDAFEADDADRRLAGRPASHSDVDTP